MLQLLFRAWSLHLFASFPHFTSGAKLSFGENLQNLRDQVYESLLQKYRIACGVNAVSIRWTDVVALNWPNDVATRTKSDWNLSDIMAFQTSMSSLEFFYKNYHAVSPGWEVYSTLVKLFQSDTSLDIPGIPWGKCMISNLPRLASYDFRKWTPEECQALMANMNSIHFLIRPQNPASLELAKRALLMSNTEAYQLLLAKFNQCTGRNEAIIPWQELHLQKLSHLRSYKHHECWTLKVRLDILENIDNVQFFPASPNERTIETKIASKSEKYPRISQDHSEDVYVLQDFQPFAIQPPAEANGAPSTIPQTSAIKQDIFNILKSLSTAVDSATEFEKCTISFESLPFTPKAPAAVPLSEDPNCYRVSKSFYYEVLMRIESLSDAFSRHLKNWNQPTFSELHKEAILRARFGVEYLGLSKCDELVPNGYSLCRRNISVKDLVFIIQSLPAYKAVEE